MNRVSIFGIGCYEFTNVLGRSIDTYMEIITGMTEA